MNMIALADYTLVAMQDIVIWPIVVWILAALSGTFGFLAVALTQSARAAAALIGAAICASGLTFLAGAQDVSIALLTITAAGVGLLLLMTALLLNLSDEETGGRRFRLQPTLHLVLLAAVAWIAFRIGGPVGATQATRLPPGAAATALFEHLGLPLSLSGLALLAAMISIFVVARRSG